jgi:hypothetical protein
MASRLQALNSVEPDVGKQCLSTWIHKFMVEKYEIFGLDRLKRQGADDETI